MDDRHESLGGEPEESRAASDECLDEDDGGNWEDEAIAIDTSVEHDEEPALGPSPPGARARISGVEAGVAAGLTQSSAGRGDQAEARDASGSRAGVHLRQHVPDALSAGSVPLPDWTDPPTREVPRILLDPAAVPSQSVPGPVWREEGSDWDLDSLAFAELVSEGSPVVEHGAASVDEEEFGLEPEPPRTISSNPVARPAVSLPPPRAGLFPDPSEAASSSAAGRPPALQGGESFEEAEADGEPIHRRSGTAWSDRLRRGWSAEPAARPIGPRRHTPPGRPGRRSFTVAEPGAQPPLTVGRVTETEPGERAGLLEPTTGLRVEGEHGRVAQRVGVLLAGRGRARHRSEPASDGRRSEQSAAGRQDGPFDAVKQTAGAAGTGGRRSPVVATLTGLAFGGVVLLCFRAGPPTVLVLICVALGVAMAECYQALRRAQYRPAALLGLVAAPGAVVAAYLKGAQGTLLVAASFVVLVFCWYLAGLTKKHPVANLSVTALGWLWVGGLGSFAGLIISPSFSGHRHGLAYLLGAIEATVAYDVGGYLFGSWLGKHKLAPSISPNKTWEGLVGGSVSAIAVAVAITALMSPWTMSRAVSLGVMVAIVAPLGDLAESMVKRDLRVKDMGGLLPAHGGLLDRIDALLFVLPATYYLVRAFHG